MGDGRRDIGLLIEAIGDINQVIDVSNNYICTVCGGRCCSEAADNVCFTWCDKECNMKVTSTDQYSNLCK